MLTIFIESNQEDEETTIVQVRLCLGGRMGEWVGVDAEARLQWGSGHRIPVRGREWAGLGCA